MSVVRKPHFKIFYNGKNITEDLSLYLLSVRYTDKVIGESDDIDITLEDTDARWQNNWYPTKGDRLKLQMGYEGSVLDCGEFEIDQIDISGPPDVVTIKAIAAWVTTPMRTRDSKAHENKTLREIAQFIASKHGLTLVGKIYTIRIARSTQTQETDLAYLERISKQFGYVFSIRGKQLVFTSVYDLEDGRPVKVIDKSDCKSYTISDKVSESYRSAIVKYHDPDKKKVTDYSYNTSSNSSNPAFGQSASKDILYVKERAENKQQAEAMAKAALHARNSRQQTLTISVEGDPLLVAGNNIELTGFGANSGKYHILSSVHTDDFNGGYITECDCKRVGYVDKVKQQPKKKRKKKPIVYTIVK